MIHAGADLEQPAMESVFTHRGHIEAYIEQNPDFLHTLAPWPGKGPYPMVVGAMVKAGRQAGVGPMAAVAGAVAEFVGRDLLQHTDEVIVENGGDVFINILKPITISVYAGQSPLSMKIGLAFPVHQESFAVCTSSGTVGHSLSHGRADAVCVLANSCALADAAATAIGNRIESAQGIQAAINWGKNIAGVRGLLAIVDKAMGAWGEMEVTPL